MIIFSEKKFQKRLSALSIAKAVLPK